MDVVKKLFNTTDLYAILSINDKDAEDPKILKKAYLSAALKNHPDKCAPDEHDFRTQKFQVLKQIYELLQDKDLKNSYDETGKWPGKENLLADLGPAVRLNEKMINDFKQEYIGSDEERDDVRTFYQEGHGSLFYVLDHLFFANIIDDESRIQVIIDELVQSGEMASITNGSDKKTRATKLTRAKIEAREAEELRRDLGMGDGDGLDSLKLALAQNDASRSGFLDDLEKKYAQAENK